MSVVRFPRVGFDLENPRNMLEQWIISSNNEDHTVNLYTSSQKYDRILTDDDPEMKQELIDSLETASGKVMDFLVFDFLHYYTHSRLVGKKRSFYIPGNIAGDLSLPENNGVFYTSLDKFLQSLRNRVENLSDLCSKEDMFIMSISTNSPNPKGGLPLPLSKVA